MPLTMKPDIPLLVEWLGPEGAIAGLERSNYTNADLMVMARERGVILDKKTTRRQLAVEIVMCDVARVDKPKEYLLQMSSDELNRYFLDRMVSTRELRGLLEELGIAPTGKLRGKLSEFAAREISELGMFQRVAKGKAEPEGR